MARPAPVPPLTPIRFLRDLALVLGVTGLAVFAATRWLAVPWSVQGPSMDPTLKDGDRVIVEVWSLARRPPEIGDVVLLEGPGGVPLVKRVAVPPRDVPQGREPSIWVLGDNASESSDSRDFGLIPVRRVRGRVIWRYWPPSAWGRIE